MALIRWYDREPGTTEPFDWLQRQINELFDAPRAYASHGVFARATSPPVDVLELPESFVVECDLPAVDQKNLDILLATIAEVNFNHVDALKEACVGGSCVVSALSGLRDVIVEVQTLLLDAAVSAGVPRFIPSDFSIDFTKMSPGMNRNLDLRREFHRRLDKAPIAATILERAGIATVQADFGSSASDLTGVLAEAALLAPAWSRYRISRSME